MTVRAKKIITRTSGEGRIQICSDTLRSAPKHARAAGTVKFGSVTVEYIAPKTAEVRRNIKAGQFALKRAKENIVTPGVRIQVGKGVPLYHADPKNPGQVIRQLNGKRESGVFVNGKFKSSR